MGGRTWFLVRRVGLVLLAIGVAFFLSAWIGSSIPRNGDWQEPDEGITILVGANAIHTEIIMPVATETIDWRQHFLLADIDDPSREYTHIGVSWGERDYFLETPSWTDFNLFTSIAALFGGEGLLHATFYVRPAPADDFRELRISPEEYRELVALILADLPALESRATYDGYSSHDVFYSGRGRYHLGNTCNQWTSDRLAAAGIETGWWTPLPGGVMKWVPRPEDN